MSATRANAMKPVPRLFDAYGNSLPPGDFSIGVFNLHHWPICRLIADETTIGHEPAATLLLPLVGPQSIPAPILGVVVGMLDSGKAVAIHARDDDSLAAVWQAILPILGGAGHA